MQLDEKTNNAAYTLRQVYQKHLLAYEDYDKGRAEEVDVSRCQPDGGAGSASERSSQDRDDAEEAADILNAIMGLSAIPKQRAAVKKPNKPAGKVQRALASDHGMGTQRPEPSSVCLCRPKLTKVEIGLTFASQTTSSLSTVNSVREATTKSRSFCAIAATRDATCSACPRLWTKFQKANGSVQYALPKMHMALLKVTSTPWKSLRKQQAHSRTTFLAAQLLQSR